MEVSTKRTLVRILKVLVVLHILAFLTVGAIIFLSKPVAPVLIEASPGPISE